MTGEEKARRAEKMFSALAEVRKPFESQIDEIIEYVQHSRRKISDKDARKGQKTGIKVYDGTAISALNLMTDGLCGYTASPSFHWYAYVLPGKWNVPRWSGMRAWTGKRMDEATEVKEWLRDSEDVTYAAFLRSNFYDCLPNFIRDGASIGTVTMWIEEDLVHDKIVFTVPHFREHYIAEDAFGFVDTNYRVYKLTLAQLVEKFGWDTMNKIDPAFKSQHESNPYAEKEIIHAVYPRNTYNPERIDSKGFRFSSEWYLRSPSAQIDNKKMSFLSESGYEDKSFITWRWRKNADETYGRSPAWDAYIEIMKANQQGRSNLIAGQKMVEGPMIATEDLRGKVQSGPSGWTFVDVNVSPDRWPRPLNEKIQLPYAVELQERTDKIIREYFHVDFFLMLYRASFEKVELTATQVVGMQAEQAAILGTRIGTLPSEAYNPIHDRVFFIEQRAGRIPQPPDILLEYVEQQARGGKGVKLEIDYLGPLAQAQKRLFRQQTLNAGVEYLTRMAQVAPEILDRVNLDQAAVEGLDALSWPANCLNDDETVETIRKLRQQERERERAIEGIGELSKATRPLGKAAEPGSLLESIKEGMAEA